MPDQALITGCVSPQATRPYTPSHRQPRYQLLELRPCVAIFRAFDDAVDFGAGFEGFDQADGGNAFDGNRREGLFVAPQAQAVADGLYALPPDECVSE